MAQHPFLNHLNELWNTVWMKKIRSGWNMVYTFTKSSILTLLLILFCGSFFVGGVGMGYFASLVRSETPLSQEQMIEKIYDMDTVSTFYYNDQSVISTVRTNDLRTITSLEKVSPYIIDGLVATEDSYFYSHSGVVPKSLVRALLQTALGADNPSGGSTITQQLIKQQILSSEVTFKRKAVEVLYALRLEKFMSKEDIIEAYLNVSPFGRNHNGLNISGIEEAAKGIFGVSAKDVSLPQAAFLVGLPQNPYTYTPYTNTAERKQDVSAGIARMKVVLHSMYREGKIKKEEYEQALQYDIEQDFLKAEPVNISARTFLYSAIERETIKILISKNAILNQTTYDAVAADSALYETYYDKAQQELATGGYKVHSTVDPIVYEAMQDAIAEYGPRIGPTYYDTVSTEEGETQVVEMAQNGAVLIENQTGRILGFIAGRDFSVNQVDHAFMTHRSPGSTIKPLLVYAPAIEHNVIYPASIVADTKISIQQPDGSYWEPTNYGNTYTNSLVTARTALIRSLNMPTIKLYQTMLSQGLNPGEYLKKMGIEGISESEYGNLALSIGGTQTGPTVQEQTTAFTTLANGGVYRPSYIIEAIENSTGEIIYQHESIESRVFSPQTAYLTTHMMTDVANSAFSVFLRVGKSFPGVVAGKTGTSEFEMDNWFIGFTPSVTLGSWIGYSNYSGQKHAIIQSDGYGAPTGRSVNNWATIMNYIYDAKPSLFTSSPFTVPSGIYSDSIVKETGTKSGEVEYNGTKLPVTGDMSTDLFKTGYGPIDPTYNFVRGGTTSDAEIYWNKVKQAASQATDPAAQQNPASSSQQPATGR